MSNGSSNGVVNLQNFFKQLQLDWINLRLFWSFLIREKKEDPESLPDLFIDQVLFVFFQIFQLGVVVLYFLSSICLHFSFAQFSQFLNSRVF